MWRVVVHLLAGAVLPEVARKPSNAIMHDHILAVGVNAVADFDRLADLRERQRLYRFADRHRRGGLHGLADLYGLASAGTSVGLVGNSVG